MLKEVSKKELDSIIINHVVASVGTGLIPLPVADIAGLTGIQLNMVRKLAEAYDVPFFKEAVKKSVTSLVGGVLLTRAGPMAASAIKAVPIIGQTIGALSMPIVCGASTYAAGRVFIRHFASGGTFLTFDSEKVKDYYFEMLKEGRKIVAEVKKSKSQQ